MAELSAALVKELREKTGAGMLDCKKALTENNGDIESSVDWLRKKGLAAAAKKAGRVAAEGAVAVASSGNVGAVVELNSETDFVARNEQFQQMAKSLAELALTTGDDVEALKAAKLPSGQTVTEALTALIATIGENMSVRRVQRLSVSSGAVATYVHGALSAGVGKIGVLVAVEGADAAKAQELGKKLAMHVAAAKPEALNVVDVDQSKVARERDIFAEQAKASGKPEEIIAKMVDGRIRKYYEEVVLMEQTSMIDGETKIAKMVADSGVKVTAFTRFGLGEGIEKVQSDFAAEVAAQAKLAS